MSQIPGSLNWGNSSSNSDIGSKFVPPEIGKLPSPTGCPEGLITFILPFPVPVAAPNPVKLSRASILTLIVALPIEVSIAKGVTSKFTSSGGVVSVITIFVSAIFRERMQSLFLSSHHVHLRINIYQ